MTATKGSRPKGPRPKHVPQRTCVGCRQVLAKRELIRIVRTDTGIQLDRTGKIPGRGAYLHDQRSCWEKAIQRGALARNLKIELTDADRDNLACWITELPPENDSPEPA